MVVRGPGETFTTKWEEKPGALGVTLQSDAGQGKAWVQTDSGKLWAR